MKVGSLFAGIGGFDLGLERAGFEIAWQVEIDPYCQRVLAKHWPHVQRYGDIRAIDWATVPRVELLCGGFPCQDLSFAGKRAGIDGERSGLWSEYVRAIRALRPQYVIVENVPGLLTNAYMGRVLGGLAQSGYDAEWDCLPASAFGAPHRRDRVWIVAYPQGHAGELQSGQREGIRNKFAIDGEARVAADVADTECERLQGGGENGSGERSTGLCGRAWKNQEQDIYQARSGWWSTEPAVGRVAHGIPHRVDRLRGLGNAVVPQIVQWLGERIMRVERENLHRMQ